MVRAIKLETTPSGVYFNPSQGIFGSATASGANSPFTLRAARSGGSLVLSWNSQSGVVYHVLARSNVNVTNWADVSGPVTAGGTNTFWIDSSMNSRSQRYYRIVTP
jgi:hypothetical protein